MKILICSSSIYEQSNALFQKNKNGLTLMLHNIAESLSMNNDVYILTHIITPKYEHNNLYFTRHRIIDILLNLKLHNIIVGFKKAIAASGSIVKRLRAFYYCIDEGSIERAIMDIKPDIISIHGIGISTEMYIAAANKTNTPYVVTLHGIIGMDSLVKASEYDKKLEKRFIQSSFANNCTVSVISSGVKSRLANGYGLTNTDNIHVILNGTNFMNSSSTECANIRAIYHIPSANRILLCVGNITPNKNQIQIVRAFDMLPEKIKETSTLLLVGRECDNYEVRRFIENNKLKSQIILCGFVDQSELSSYYLSADLNIFPSMNDGFGLPIIEGFSFGLPVVTFSDLDAIPDLYNNSAMCLTSDRSDNGLAHAICEGLSTHWDREAIKEYSEKFRVSKVGTEYQALFEEVIQNAK